MEFIYSEKYLKKGRYVITGYSGEDEIITIPEEVERIAEGAFAGNSRIKKVIVPNKDRYLDLSSEAFRDCTSLESVTFYSSLFGFRKSVFEGCTALVEVSCAHSRIGIRCLERAFAGCKNLQSINIQELRPENGTWCVGCDKLADENGMIIRDGVLYGVVKPCKELCIPKEIKRINGYALSFSQLEKLSFEKGSAAEIGPHAFGFSYNLHTVILPDKIKVLGESAFENCKALRQIEIPKTVTGLGYATFLSCELLEKVILNKGLKKIGAACFHGCKSLKEVVIPETVKEISSAFNSCDCLERIIINSDRIKIDPQVFDPSWKNEEFSATKIVASSIVGELLPENLKKNYQPVQGEEKQEKFKQIEVYKRLNDPDIKEFVDRMTLEFDFSSPVVKKDKTYKLMIDNTVVQVKIKMAQSLFLCDAGFRS